MTFEPMLAASLAVKVHTAAALGALGLGTVQLVAPKGTVPHRRLGWAWVVLMAVVALSSFAITDVTGHYSFIHLISVFVLVALPRAVVAARRGRIEAHRKGMLGIFVGGLVVAGLLTLWPGRIIGRMVFGG